MADTAELKDVIEELIEKIDTLTGNAIPVKFNAPADLAALKEILKDVLGKQFEKTNKIQETVIKETAKTTKEQTELLKKQKITLEKFVTQKNSIDSKTEKTLSELNISIKGLNKKKDDKDDEYSKAIAKGKKALEIVTKAVPEIFNNLGERFTERIKLNIQLQESGVRLQKGFDAQFYKLAAMAGRTSDAYTQLLKTNSSFVAQMNSVGLDGAQTISKMLNTTIGQWGATFKESDLILRHITENMTAMDSIHTMKSINFESEMETTTKLLKQLSAATGKSVEQIIKETEARKSDFVHRRLMTDERTKHKYSALQAAGFAPELIESILTGTPNKQSVLASVVAPQLMREVMGLAQSNISSEQFASELANAGQRNAHEVERWNKSFSLGILPLLRGGSFGETLSLFDGNIVAKGGMNVVAGKQAIDNTNVDTAGTNAYIKLQGAFESLEAIIEEKMTPTIENSIKSIDNLASVVDSVGKNIEEYLPSSLSTSVGVAKDILSPLVNVGIPIGGFMAYKGLKNIFKGGSKATAAKNIGSKAVTTAKNVGSKSLKALKPVSRAILPLAVVSEAYDTFDFARDLYKEGVDGVKKQSEEMVNSDSMLDKIAGWSDLTRFGFNMEAFFYKKLEDIFGKKGKSNNTSISESAKMPSATINEPVRQLQESIEDASSKNLKKETIPNYKSDISRIISLLDDISKNTNKTLIHNLT